MLLPRQSAFHDMKICLKLTVAGSPTYSPTFMQYCAMMKRTDLLTDAKYATARLRRQNLAPILEEVRAWLAGNLRQLQAQVSEVGLAVGTVRAVKQFAPRGGQRNGTPW
jgi:CoA:oxalate CoA-transferase